MSVQHGHGKATLFTSMVCVSVCESSMRAGHGSSQACLCRTTDLELACSAHGMLHTWQASSTWSSNNQSQPHSDSAASSRHSLPRGASLYCRGGRLGQSRACRCRDKHLNCFMLEQSPCSHRPCWHATSDPGCTHALFLDRIDPRSQICHPA